jgi:hypothetical protein
VDAALDNGGARRLALGLAPATRDRSTSSKVGPPKHRPRAKLTLEAMPDLELTRSSDDRRLYVLGGVGTLRLQGFLSRSAIAEAVADD